jgi:hypothetical protein
MRILKAVIATLCAAIFSAFAGAPKPAHPEWHVVRTNDAFEAHTWVGGSGRSGKDWMVAQCEEQDGFTLMIWLDAAPRPRADAILDDERTILLKVGDAASVQVSGHQTGKLVSIEHAGMLAPLFADNRDVGVHVKAPDGRAWDARFTFSTMAAATRQTLLSCSHDHART